MNDMICESCGKSLIGKCIQNGITVINESEYIFGRGDLFKCECGHHTANGFNVVGKVIQNDK